MNDKGIKKIKQSPNPSINPAPIPQMVIWKPIIKVSNPFSRWNAICQEFLSSLESLSKQLSN